MSETQAKFVVRGRIRSLDNTTANEAFRFFAQRLGEPHDAYGKHGDDHFDFSYEHARSGGWGVVRTEASFRPGLWGIDFVVLDAPEGHDPWPGSISLPDLADIVMQMQERFGVKWDDIFVTAYTWYNGVDEPISLDMPGKLPKEGA